MDCNLPKTLFLTFTLTKDVLCCWRCLWFVSIDFKAVLCRIRCHKDRSQTLTIFIEISHSLSPSASSLSSYLCPFFVLSSPLKLFQNAFYRSSWLAIGSTLNKRHFLQCSEARGHSWTYMTSSYPLLAFYILSISIFFKIKYSLRILIRVLWIACMNRMT